MTVKGTGTAIDYDQNGTNEAVAEPSMEEILASIRAIISDDEPDDGLTARERYTHPTDVSNTNTPVKDSQPRQASAAALPHMRTSRASDGSVPVGAQSDVTDASQDIPLDRTEQLRARAEALKAEITAGTRRSGRLDDAADGAKLSGASAEPVRGFEAAVTPPTTSASADDDSDADMLEIERLANALRSREAAASNPPKAPVQTQSVQPTVETAAPVFAQPAPAVQAPAPAQTTAQPSTSEVADAVARMMLDAQGDELKVAIQDMMTPIVRKWLGDNLPTMVERLVRDEIERAARGG